VVVEVEIRMVVVEQVVEQEDTDLLVLDQHLYKVQL
jgi:hypothetical protein